MWSWKGVLKGSGKALLGVVIVAGGVGIVITAGPAIGVGAALGATGLMISGAIVGSVGVAETLENTTRAEKNPASMPIMPGEIGANYLNKNYNYEKNPHKKQIFNICGILFDTLLTAPLGGAGGAVSTLSTSSEALSGAGEILDARDNYVEYLKEKP